MSTSTVESTKKNLTTATNTTSNTIQKYQRLQPKYDEEVTINIEEVGEGWREIDSRRSTGRLRHIWRLQKRYPNSTTENHRSVSK